MVANGLKATTPQLPGTAPLKAPLHYTEYNPEGTETIVLLHDLFQNGSSQWDAVRPYLPFEFRLLIVDWPGHGLSPLPGNGFDDTPRQFATILSQWMTRSVRGTCHMVGAGLGAYAALHVALGYPQRVASLTLVGYLHHADAVVRAQWASQRETLRLALETGSSVDLSARYGHDQWQKMNLDILADLMTYPPHTMPDDFERLEMPTLLVSGDAVEIERRQALQIRDWAPQAHLAVIPDAGHNAMLDAPAIFGGILSRFLRTPG